MTNKTRSNKRKKSNNKTKKKFSISNSIYNIPKTIYKSNDFNTIKYPQIPIIKYIALRYVDNMVKASTVKNERLKKYILIEYTIRLRILLKNNPKLKKEFRNITKYKIKNIDKLPPTKLEKVYFHLLNLEN